MFDLWIKGCEINNSIVYLLDGSGDNGFYKLTKQYVVSNTYYYETPVFIGWRNGKQVVTSTNYVEAYNIWKEGLDEKF